MKNIAHVAATPLAMTAGLGLAFGGCCRSPGPTSAVPGLSLAPRPLVGSGVGDNWDGSRCHDDHWFDGDARDQGHWHNGPYDQHWGGGNPGDQHWGGGNPGDQHGPGGNRATGTELL
jgi:hypothetical protein